MNFNLSLASTKSLSLKSLITLLALTVNISLYGQYSLEQSLGAPYVQSIHASADSEGLAYVVNEQGERNIFYADLEGKTEKLTNYNADNGLDIGQINIASGYLLFVRGNGNNRYGQPANPAGIPITPQRQLLRLRMFDKKIDTIDVASPAGTEPQ